MSIEVNNVHKMYRTRVKAEGLSASLRALWNPEYKDVCAVHDISFRVEPGEIVAFIGPNGAGKSTMIKMLTGILHATSGSLSVLGMDPAKQREQLAFQIGTVFGQRSQLWMHLPPADSYALLASIYELDSQVYRLRLAELAELFELEELLNVPVRKLSLGQRIRCEVAASLLHRPKVIFLDEPTIGLDVIVKQKIRDLIVRLNREEGTTIFLTSHDAGDIEQLCKRALVINSGQLVIDDDVAAIKQSFFNRKIIDITYQQEFTFALPEGVSLLSSEGRRAQLVVDTRLCEVGTFLAQLVSSGAISDVTINDPPMEEIIAAIFQQKERLGDGHVAKV